MAPGQGSLTAFLERSRHTSPNLDFDYDDDNANDDNVSSNVPGTVPSTTQLLEGPPRPSHGIKAATMMPPPATPVEPATSSSTTTIIFASPAFSQQPKGIGAWLGFVERKRRRAKAMQTMREAVMF